MSRAEPGTWPDAERETIRPLAEHEFEQIRRLAHRSFGLDLKPGKEELVASRLGRLVRNGGFRSFHEYYRHIVGDATGEALASMIDALATNHTAFLREPDHFEFLRREVLPKLTRPDAVEIWSAACSTGEEVWTVACVLNDALGPRRGQITASDISTRALRFAEQGSYPIDRCAGLPAAWLGRYFEPVDRSGNGYRVCAALRAQATFRRNNLVQPYTWARRFPAIFCRNVMIYFDPATQEQVVRQLSEWLEPGGYLFVGHAESLTRIPHSLEYVQPAIYRKPAERKSRWNRSS
jgi:chemotaxis protein methyltransferase CheR